MKVDDYYKCDYCGNTSPSLLAISVTIETPNKHFCNAVHFINYCDNNKYMQKSLTYAMYKDFLDSTESNIPQTQGDGHEL